MHEKLIEQNRSEYPNPPMKGPATGLGRGLNVGPVLNKYLRTEKLDHLLDHPKMLLSEVRKKLSDFQNGKQKGVFRETKEVFSIFGMIRYTNLRRMETFLEAHLALALFVQNTNQMINQKTLAHRSLDNPGRNSIVSSAIAS